MVSSFLLSQILIGIAFIFDLSSFQFKNRKHILICFAIAASLISAHFFLLGEYTAGSVVALSAIRFIVSIFTTNKRMMWLFLVLILIAGIVTFDGFEDILSISAMLLSTFSAFSAADKKLRLFMMCGTVLMITHNIIIFTPAAVLLESFFLASNLFAYYRFYFKQQSHAVRLHPQPFAMVRDGNKTIETRLNDEKRRSFKIGDTLTFVSREDGAEVKTEIVALHTHKTFKALFKNHKATAFGGESPEELIENIYQFYSEEDEQKWGVVGIEFKII